MISTARAREYRSRFDDGAVPVGLPLQDCVVAWHAYRRATDHGVRTEVEFEQ